ncbi:hypothetical protein EYF80_020608 [Liparis tanakae]|uniref:Uncharacterized protein n=1 Tax=Liparis tanakae TaxID=230148 RepID=A0A4Z2HUB9_9TELE|nr:hypothetical protein EYF80_020608 [Liparis tanakae]
MFQLVTEGVRRISRTEVHAIQSLKNANLQKSPDVKSRSPQEGEVQRGPVMRPQVVADVPAFSRRTHLPGSIRLRRLSGRVLPEQSED